MSRYEAAYKCVDSDTGLDDDQKAKATGLKAAVASNLSLCALKVKDYTKAKVEADKALEAEPENVKVRVQLCTVL